MTLIVGPYAAVEHDYRGERIAESFRSHRKGGKRRFGRRSVKIEQPAIDWYAG